MLEANTGNEVTKKMTPIDSGEPAPLTPLAFDILLSLLDGAAHGYAVMQAVQDRGAAVGSVHAGTLYRALARLVDAALIEELEEPPAEADERRRYYRVTSSGRKAAAAEARRLERQLGTARAHGLLEPA